MYLINKEKKMSNFKPVNRYVEIQLSEQEPNETQSGILLPDDFKPTEERYAVANVISAADDVKFLKSLEEGCSIILDKTMVENINFGGESINVVLENYIVGIIN